MFEYSRHILEGCVIYELQETLTMGKQSQELGASLNTLNEVACLRVLFNCAKLKSIDSSGIGVLMIWKKLIENLGGVLAMAVPAQSLVGRAFASFCMDKIIPIFPTRDEAVIYLKTRHMDAVTLQKAALRTVAKNRSSDDEIIIREICKQFPNFPDAIAFLEKCMLEVCAKTFTALLIKAQINRLIGWLGALPNMYEANPARREGAALIIGTETAMGFAHLAESLLAWTNMATYNGAACDLSTANDVMEAIKAVKPTHLALCMGCEKDWAKAVRTGKMLQSLELKPKMICYAPVMTPGQEPLPGDMALCAEISQMHGLL